MRVLLPNTKSKGLQPNAFHTDKWFTFTNMKASIDFSGMKEHGGVYNKFIIFYSGEIEHNLIMYVIQGLFPNPQIL